MKLILFGLLALGAAGSIMAVHDGDADESIKTAAITQAKGGEHYQMQVFGREGDCRITKRGPANAVEGKLVLSDKCLALMPRLADARYWREKPAGDVSFVSEDGRKIIQFFPSDGLAYESLYPKMPLVALKAL